MYIPKPLFIISIVAIFVIGYLIGTGITVALAPPPSDPAPTTMTPDERYLTCLDTLHKLNLNSGGIEDLDPNILSCDMPKD